MLPLTKIGFFNPGRLSDGEIEQSFIARIAFFEFILKRIVAEDPNSIPQHHLIIGQRGMGKSSLLVRIAAELRKPPYKDSFIPLSFPEEQYNIDRLAKFWLNCLDALADALDKEHEMIQLASLDAEISSLSKEKALDPLTAYNVFKKWIDRLNRRPVLLVDNLNLIFAKLNREEQHQLRAILISNEAPILVGASTIAIDETINYDEPFYDAFQIHYLKKLDFQESMEVLVNLARITGNTTFEDIIYTKRGRLEALYQLTGGTPRTLAIIFPLIQDGFSENIQTDLDALLDIITPLYKSRFEELPEQLQVVMDAVALHWDPVNLEQIRDITMLQNSQLSPQLKRLVDVGWLQRLDAYQAKGGAYELSERFFNIWYLMRRSSRRQKKELYSLTKFLESFYGNDLHEFAKLRLTQKSNTATHIALDLALAEALRDDEMSSELRNKSYDEIMDLCLNDDDILDHFPIPKEITEKKIREWFDKIDDLLRQNKEIEAEPLVKKLGKIGDGPVLYWNRFGYMAQQVNNLELAEKAFRRAIELAENPANSWNSLGNLYRSKLKKYPEAEQFYLKAIESSDRAFIPWSNLGNLYLYNFKDYTKAGQAFAHAVELNNDHYRAWVGLGRSNVRLSRFMEAEKAFIKAHEINNKEAAPLLELGQLYKNHLSNNQEAEKAYKKAIDLDSKSLTAWRRLGQLYLFRTNKYEDAEWAFKKAIELDDTDAVAWACLGILYSYCQTRYVEAELAFKNAIEREPMWAWIWTALGIVYKDDLGKYQEAEQAFKKAIELDPKDFHAWFDLGSLYMRFLREYKEAERALKTASDLDDQSDLCWQSLGMLYQDHLGQYQKAEWAYEKSLAIAPSNADNKYNLIFLWRDKLNKLTQARELFDSLSESERIKDTHLLNAAIFAFYEKNAGIAGGFLQQALLETNGSLTSRTINDWYRTAAAIIRLGFADSLLHAFTDTGYDQIFKPFYVAIQALAKKEDPLFLNSIAAEIREPAIVIMNLIEQS